MSAPEGHVILIADDNDDQRALYVDLLTHAGYRVSEARDGAEAIERARADRPALILMDVTMPGTSGWNAVRAIRDQLETQAIPIIVITGLAGTRDRDASFAAGSDAYLSKPVLPRQLLEEVRRFLPS
ncbi:MAG: Signal transduction response regulator [Gemmatimonadetes bacterium]|nr:Signal transduction response regulator [Gemmatimonadota bacterium]